jgi:hypothetical protein
LKKTIRVKGIASVIEFHPPNLDEHQALLEISHQHYVTAFSKPANRQRLAFRRQTKATNIHPFIPKMRQLLFRSTVERLTPDVQPVSLLLR